MDGAGLFPVGAGARIGPNAILQLVRVLDHVEGRSTRDRVIAAAGVPLPPDDAGMWPEADCRAVHVAVHQVLPARADGVLRLAGIATADYILAHRIPRAAQAVIRILPGFIGARVLTTAISRHAWTFVGSGRFSVPSFRPLTFQIAENPLSPGAGHSCVWHAAVFERLFRRLVWPSAMVSEVECEGAGGPVCLFVIRPQGR
jgi:divinyl protochlorophyllide a 8-vinyl-reductase